MDPRIKAYIAGLAEKMEKMTPAQRHKLIASIRQKAKGQEKDRLPVVRRRQ